MAQSGTILGVILRLFRACLRRVFNLSFLAALSLLLGIGLGCLWVRTTRINEWLTHVRSSGLMMTLGTAPGQLFVEVYIPSDVPPNYPTDWGYSSQQCRSEVPASYLARMWKETWLGFELHRQVPPHRGRGWHRTEIAIPLWFPMVLTLVFPFCWLRRWRRKARRVRLGLCLHRGYDLRATPDSTGPRVARCPECGRESP